MNHHHGPREVGDSPDPDEPEPHRSWSLARLDPRDETVYQESVSDPAASEVGRKQHTWWRAFDGHPARDDGDPVGDDPDDDDRGSPSGCELVERELAGIPRVERVDRWGPRATDHGHPQTTMIARATRWGSCPNVLVLAVIRQGHDHDRAADRGGPFPCDDSVTVRYSRCGWVLDALYITLSVVPTFTEYPEGIFFRLAHTWHRMPAQIDLEVAYQDFIENPDDELSLEHRLEKKQTFQNLLYEEEFSEFENGELRELVRNLWAFAGWTNKDYIVNEMLEDGLDHVVESLYKALYEVDDAPDQFEILVTDIRMMGPAAASEILTFMHPNRCAIYNQRAEEAMAVLGYGEELPSRIADADNYRGLLTVLDEIQTDIEDLDIDDGVPIRDYIDLDYFLYHVSKMEVEEEEQEVVEPAEFDHDSIQAQLLEIGDGLGFDVEPEYDAGPRARIDVRWSTRVANLGMISYAFEVHHHGSPDSAILNLKKAEAADPSVQKSVIVSQPDNIEKFKEEIKAMGGDFAKNVSYLTGKEVAEAEQSMSDLKSFLRQAGLTQDLS